MTSIANGELGLSVRTKLNDLLTASDALSLAVTDAQTAASDAELAAASASATATALTGFDLAAIAASKAITAVDGFVYDTSKDSDGGAWRKRCQHTSWYNETLNTATRGSRREFPAVAVIVAEAAKVTIYDGDDPSLPMWMVFDGNGNNHFRSAATGIFALNGYLGWSSSTSGAGWSNFAEDASFYMAATFFRQSIGSISQRNSLLGFVVLSTSIGIVNSTVNDIAMTVLPDAPIDPATGLQVPTIAVATAGGVSVIKDDGTVTDSAQTFAINFVLFRPDGSPCYRRTGSPEIYAATSYAADGFGTRIYDFDLQPYGFLFGSSGVGFASDGNNLFVGRNVGLETYLENTSALTLGMVAYTTSTYNTGWMNGNIKGAFLSDTSATALVGSDELVTNGTFDTDVSGWTVSAGLSATVSSGQVTLTNDTGFTAYSEKISQTVSGLIVGKTYVLSLNYISGTNRVRFTWSAPFTQQYSNTATSVTFVATATSGIIQVFLDAASLGNNATIDNISVKLADADRSVNNKGLIVNGTITRTAVATGADLVAYSGFSSANYLEQPYNSALDFGTGDFCVMGWANIASSGAIQYLLTRYAVAGTNPEWSIRKDASNNLTFNKSDGAVVCTSATPLSSWAFIVFTRTSGLASLYINGILKSSSAFSDTVTNAASVLRFGDISLAGSSLPFQGSLALWRISATAPTAEAIKKIYNDEKVLFQDGAQATLYGASDAVTALAYDDDTNLLSVGTSAGRSDFQGLRRVANTTTAVSTFISAGNNMIVEQ